MAQFLWLPEAVGAAITAVYLTAVLFKLLMVCYGSAARPRLGADDGADDRLDAELPVYTVLVPLVAPDRAAGQSGRLVAELSAMDYPASRLEVLLLAGDAGERLPGDLPAHFEVVNAGAADQAEAYAMGLAMARGELCVGYEPGQHPAPGQLRAASRAFAELPSWVVCLQSEARCQNPDASWLTRCAAAEQAVNSALLLRGLDRFRLVLPARGASCHFRTDALRQLGAWQDGDDLAATGLGVRIARRGWAVRMLASVTAEEVEDRLGPWFTQRAAALRDSYRSWSAHARSPLRLCRDLGLVRAGTLQLGTALSACTALANPLFWLLAAVWAVGGSATVADVFPLGEASVVVAAMLLANLLTAYSLMIGCMEEGMFPAVRTMFLAPGYWALMSVAAYRALLPPGRRAPARMAVPSVAAS